MVGRGRHENCNPAWSCIITSDWRRCAVACAQDDACVTYSHYDLGLGACQLKDSLSPKTALSYSRIGTKFSL